jgi:hypothetical protein
MGDNFKYQAGLHNVGSYQVSAVPFVTGALTAPISSSTDALAVSFPTVTKYFEVYNSGSTEIRIGYSNAGVKGSNYYPLKAGSQIRFDIKCDKVYIISANGSANSGVHINAGLTGITLDYSLATAYSGSVGIG